MRGKREGSDRKSFCDLFFVERLNDLEVKVFGLASNMEKSGSSNELDFRMEQNIEHTLMDMIYFSNDVIHNSSQMMLNYNLKLEFTRMDRNKLIKRLIMCLKFFVSFKKFQLRRLEIITCLVQCICNLFDIYNKLSMANNVPLVQDKVEMNSEIPVLVEILQLLRYLLTRNLIYRQDVTKCFLTCITFCVQSMEDYKNLCDAEYQSKANSILTLVGIILIEDTIAKTLIAQEHMPRDLVIQSADCLSNCIQFGPSLFGTLFNNKFFDRLHYILQLLFSQEQAIYVKNLVGECWNESFMKFLSKLHEILSICIINFDQSVSVMAEFTLILINNYWDTTTVHLESIAPFLFIYELSKKKSPFIVNDILQSSLIQTIFSLLGKKDLSQELHTSITSFLSFMISSLNSNDIYNIHMLSDYLSSKVILPFLSFNDSENDKENVPLMITRLLQERRLIPLLVENQFQKHVELLLGEEAEHLIGQELKELLCKTEKELSHMKTMLKMLPHEEKQLLQITEGVQFKKSLEEK
nr:unnamed protein product [Naegleria fowleri]